MIEIIKSNKDVRYRGKCQCGCEFRATADDVGIREFHYRGLLQCSIRVADCPECLRATAVNEERNP